MQILRRFYANKTANKYFVNLTDWEEEGRKHFTLALDYIHESGVKGDLAEFGTYMGKTAAWIARASINWEWKYKLTSDDRYKPRQLFLFDSFEGLPDSESQIDQISPHVLAGNWRGGRMKGLSPDQLKAVCEVFIPAERILIFKGWFKDSVQRIPAGSKFAMINVDCDLYQSAIDVLDYLFSHGLLSEGAVIFFDDWNTNHASPEYGERKAWAEMVGKYSVNYSDWGPHGWSCHKFIVHSYTPHL